MAVVVLQTLTTGSLRGGSNSDSVQTPQCTVRIAGSHGEPPLPPLGRQPFTPRAAHICVIASSALLRALPAACWCTAVAPSPAPRLRAALCSATERLARRFRRRRLSVGSAGSLLLLPPPPRGCTFPILETSLVSVLQREGVAAVRCVARGGPPPAARARRPNTGASQARSTPPPCTPAPPYARRTARLL